jgi:hypothetical protein
MKMMASYVSAVYGLTPDEVDLEGALFEVDNASCQKSQTTSRDGLGSPQEHRSGVPITPSFF